MRASPLNDGRDALLGVGVALCLAITGICACSTSAQDPFVPPGVAASGGSAANGPPAPSSGVPASGGGSGAPGAGSGSANAGSGRAAGGSGAVELDSGSVGSTGSATGGQAGSGYGGTPGPVSAVGFDSNREILTGVRTTTAPPATQTMHFHNGGPIAVDLTSLAVTGANQSLFQIDNPPSLPMKLAPGADLLVTLRLMTGSAALPAPLPEDSGSTLLTGALSAALSSGSVQSEVYGLVLTQDIWEPTLGQILTTLGFKLNVGQAQNNWNPNRGKPAQNLPGVEPGTDEIAAPLFVKAAAGSVTMNVVARFSPKGPLPYGWYPPGNSSARTVVGTMAEIADAQTSNKSRMVRPPLAAGSSTTFDPGSGPFGIWVYSDQATQKYDTGVATNGDYDFSQDALNTPANVHRFKVYPLKDAGGSTVANSYMLAVEEATNGDYQDYVYVLGNVNVAP